MKVTEMSGLSEEADTAKGATPTDTDELSGHIAKPAIDVPAAAPTEHEPSSLTTTADDPRSTNTLAPFSPHAATGESSSSANANVASSSANPKADAQLPKAKEEVKHLRPGEGWAPIKAEFIRPREQRVAKVEPTADDVAAGSASVKDKKRGKGRNHQRPKDSRPPADSMLCPDLAKGTKCRFGESCRYSHDAKAYLESKGPDLAEMCPIWDVRGSCPSGLRCRFGSSHIDPDTLIPLVRPGTADPSTFETINDLDRELQGDLRRNKIRFACDRRGWKVFLSSLDAEYAHPSAAAAAAAAAGKNEKAGNGQKARVDNDETKRVNKADSHLLANNRAASKDASDTPSSAIDDPSAASNSTSPSGTYSVPPLPPVGTAAAPAKGTTSAGDFVGAAPPAGGASTAADRTRTSAAGTSPEVPQVPQVPEVPEVPEVLEEEMDIESSPDYPPIVASEKEPSSSKASYVKNDDQSSSKEPTAKRPRMVGDSGGGGGGVLGSAGSVMNASSACASSIVVPDSDSNGDAVAVVAAKNGNGNDKSTINNNDNDNDNNDNDDGGNKDKKNGHTASMTSTATAAATAATATTASPPLGPANTHNPPKHNGAVPGTEVAAFPKDGASSLPVAAVNPGVPAGEAAGRGGEDWVRACLEGQGPRESRTVDFEGKVYVAPLTTVGNLPFRRLLKDLGADITCGEMAIAHHLLKGQGSEWALLRRHPCEDIFGVQVAGAHPDQMTRVAELLEKHAKVDFVDINMGCPIDLVCDKGMGAALMNRGRKLRGIIAGMTSQLSCPLTVKMRVGWDEKKPNADTVVRTVQREAERCRFRGFPGSVAYVMVHGRSRLQRYSRLADWSYVRKVAASQDDGLKPIPVIGNGDILSWRDHEEQLQQARESELTADVEDDQHKRWSTCCMLARGALIKPWLPTEVKEGRDWDISSSERLDIYRDFVRYGLEHWGSDQMGVNKTRRFLLEWLSFTHRYIPVGLLEVLPQRINERPLPYYGRNELEGLMCSQNAHDWVKISEMLLGPVPTNFEFEPKHKANSYAPLAVTS